MADITPEMATTERWAGWGSQPEPAEDQPKPPVLAQGKARYRSSAVPPERLPSVEPRPLRLAWRPPWVPASPQAQGQDAFRRPLQYRSSRTLLTVPPCLPQALHPAWPPPQADRSSAAGGALRSSAESFLGCLCGLSGSLPRRAPRRRLLAFGLRLRIGCLGFGGLAGRRLAALGMLRPRLLTGPCTCRLLALTRQVAAARPHSQHRWTKHRRSWTQPYRCWLCSADAGSPAAIRARRF
jgi:hypothetical protein